MKKLLLILSIALCMPFAALAQNALNDKADSIVGEYLVPSKDTDSKVRFTKNADGSFDCQVFWLEHPNDAAGKPLTDEKNPDKSLRSRKVDGLYIIKGLKYNASKKQWDGAKVYDPGRGISANVTITFQADGNLQVKGTIMGIGEKQTWKKLK